MSIAQMIYVEWVSGLCIDCAVHRGTEPTSPTASTSLPTRAQTRDEKYAGILLLVLCFYVLVLTGSATTY